jgi:hypothetical protein
MQPNVFSHLLLWTIVGIRGTVLAQGPLVTTVNGTYQGAQLASWNQDAFLGIPFAQPPVKDLRWRWPQSLNESFSETRDATHQGYSCMQYTGNFNMSEDCLNLNVVRPTGNFTMPLPVLVWIFGGGLYTGSVADPQYNLSGIVKVSQDMGQPIIAVAMNYRLNMYGFLQTPQLLAEGSSNAGLLDQRMALRWIQVATLVVSLSGVRVLAPKALHTSCLVTMAVMMDSTEQRFLRAAGLLERKYRTSHTIRVP